MASTVGTMSIPYATSFVLESAAAAKNESQDLVAAASLGDEAAAPFYTTPERLAGLAAVTPSTATGAPAANATTDHNGGRHAKEYHPELKSDGDIVVSASNSEESTAAESAPPAYNIPLAPAAFAAPAPVARYPPQNISAAHHAAVAHFAAPAMASAKKIKKAHSIQLGPRVTPAIRKSSLQPHPQTAVKRQASAVSAHSSPVKPRNLGSVLKTGDSSQFAPLAYASAGPAMKEEECPSTPAAQNNHIPAPSSFLAAQISPLRSSARRNGEKSTSKPAPSILREKTPLSPPSSSNMNMDPSKLSPGMFLSPRTPKYLGFEAKAGTKTSGLTPRFTPGLTPGLTPTNFASDFGKGHKKEGSLGPLDASNVFAWLHSPTANGLFTPSGGLHSLSATNTPRGMYGFSGPPGTAIKGPPRLAPSPSKMPPSLTSSSSTAAHSFFAGLEGGGDIGVNTPRIPENQRSMICISPLASKRPGKGKPVEGAPETPMSINFSEVFASPRLPTPRLSSRAAKKDSGMMSSSNMQASPVASALHTAQHDINLDDDLNALLQLAETTTPGGRPMTFMSPLLTHSLRRVTNLNPEVGGKCEPPSSLQLPIISGSSISEEGSSQRKMRRNGLGSRGAISPPQLAIRSTSSGSMLDGINSPAKSSTTKKSKKRKAPTPSSGSSDHQYQQPGYPHPNMQHYRHPHAAHPSQHPHGYYPHPGYHSNSHHSHMQYPGYPAPQQHYAYSEQQPPAAAASAASASPEKASPPKSARKSKSVKSRSKSSKSKSMSKTPTKASASRLITPSSTGSSKRARKSTAKAAGNSSAKKQAKTVAPSDPNEKERITAAIYAVNRVYGDGTEKDKKLAAATLRGVTMRPSGKWQAQLYYSGKSRYIGVFDSKEKASLAYEIAREVLNTDKDKPGPANAEETDRNVTLARKAAFAGVSEHAAK